VLNPAYPADSLEEQRRHLCARTVVAGIMFRTTASRSPWKIAGHCQCSAAVPEADGHPHSRQRVDPRCDSHRGGVSVDEILFLTMGGDDWRTAVAAAKRQLNIYSKSAAAWTAIRSRQRGRHYAAPLAFGSGLPFSDPQLTLGS